MIRTGMFSRLACLVGPLVLPAFAAGQEPKPAVEETSVHVTEGRVVVVEDEPKPAKAKAEGEVTIERRSVPALPKVPARAFTFSPMPRQAQPRRAADAMPSQLGLELAEADDTLRSQLQLPAGQGLVVVTVKPDGPAGQSGLKPNDVIIALGDSKLRSLNQARARLTAIGKDPIEVKVIRGGKETRLSLVGPKHGEGFEPEATEYWIGVPVSPVDATLRSHLADLPADSGLIANDVVADSPAAKAGVKKNDILVKLGGNPLRDAGALVAQVQAAGDKPTPLELFRAGKPITVTITPDKRARRVAYEFNAGREPNGSFNFVFPKPGVEVMDPKQHEIILKEVNKFVEAQAGNKPGQKPLDIHLEMLTSKAKAAGDEANAKVEAGLKEMKASIEELKKAIEALKKPEAK